MKTKHPYLKEILKTTAKVALIAAGTYFFAAPFAWGLTATVLNATTAAEVAELAVTCFGAYAAAKTAIKDIFTMRERVKKQQREEYVDEQLAELKKGLKKNHPQKADHTKGRQIQPKVFQEQVQPKKDLKWKKFNPFLWKKNKEYDRAA